MAVVGGTGRGGGDWGGGSGEELGFAQVEGGKIMQMRGPWVSLWVGQCCWSPTYQTSHSLESPQFSATLQDFGRPN